MMATNHFAVAHAKYEYGKGIAAGCAFFEQGYECLLYKHIQTNSLSLESNRFYDYPHPSREDRNPCSDAKQYRRLKPCAERDIVFTLH